MKPIQPHEIAEQVVKTLPTEVIGAFNELIAENYVNGSATVLQKNVVARIIEKLDCTREEIFNRGWLNVEEVYRKAGWTVKYDKPAYCESYEAFFEFRKK